MKNITKIDGYELRDLMYHAVAISPIGCPGLTQDIQDELISMIWGKYYDEIALTARQMHRRFGNDEWKAVWQYIEANTGKPSEEYLKSIGLQNEQ